MKNVIRFCLFVTVLGFGFSVSAQEAMKKDDMKHEDMMKHDDMKMEKAKVVKLVQTPGEFKTTKLNLKPGNYIFEVTNKGIDHEVAFFLTQDGKTQIENSGLPNTLKNGETARTGVVTLKPGSYEYSCPLNPTPHYKVNVKSK
jgi:plastocyanin